jgi:hypothetical protein
MRLVNTFVRFAPQAEAESVAGKSIKNFYQALVQPDHYDQPKDGRSQRPY